MILAGNSIIFIANEGKAVSISINEKAIDQGMPIDSVVHHQDLMIDIWADESLMYCLSSTGHIDIIKYRKPGIGAIRSSDLHISVFTKSTPKSDSHAAVANSLTQKDTW